MEATLIRTIGQGSSGTSADEVPRQGDMRRQAGRACAAVRTGLGCALTLALALGACQQRSAKVDIPPAAGVDAAATRDVSSIIGGTGGPSDGSVGADRVTLLDSGLCTGVNFETDPYNCGKCGTVCPLPLHAQAACVAGKCGMGTCNPGYVDLDTQPGTGCECALSNGGVEICDGKDNNCDGQIDEGFNLQTDAANCGKCGNVCAFAHANGLCQQGKCGFACLPGYVDLDGNPENGCEYACTPSNNGIEICDGKDNDCDGTVDEGAIDVGQPCGDNGCQAGVLTCIAGVPVCVGGRKPTQEVCDGIDNDCNGFTDESDPNLGKPCYPVGSDGCNLQTGVCAGQCHMGAWVCTSGALVCPGAVTPQLEICDGKDNDCDGLVDEDFDLQTDPRHCGSCDRSCAYTHAIGLCSSGQCHMGPCQDGWVDADHNPSNGCEYACTPDGPEICDGKDNDCNGLTDGDDPGIVQPTVNFCRQGGECGKGPGGSTHFPGDASFPVCTTPSGASKPSWICNYPATVQLTGPNQIVAQESWCDGLDNDCDGAVDEFASAVLGTPCSDNTGLGECRRVGTVKCQADKTLAPACDLSGSAATTPTDEICDGKDNDCDGLTDESWDNPAGLGLPQCAGQECKGVRDAVVHVTAAGAPGNGYYIYSYEASRVDASATSMGSSSARACSRATSAPNTGVLPWSSVTWVAADAACRAAGMRLCKGGDAATADEWGFACELGKTCTSGCYPYGSSYDATLCNGAESNLNAAVAVGSFKKCITSGDLDSASTDEAVFDMSGNLAEWTDDLRGPPLADGRNIYTVRGGAFDSFSVGLGCSFMAAALAQDFSYPDTGFRCCSSCGPGLADCNGSCANLASDSANCGACGTACTAPATCKNGACK
jgi:hypothetical protein